VGRVQLVKVCTYRAIVFECQGCQLELMRFIIEVRRGWRGRFTNQQRMNFVRPYERPFSSRRNDELGKIFLSLTLVNDFGPDLLTTGQKDHSTGT
jgi:hypothetical protein